MNYNSRMRAMSTVLYVRTHVLYCTASSINIRLMKMSTEFKFSRQVANVRVRAYLVLYARTVQTCLI